MRGGPQKPERGRSARLAVAYRWLEPRAGYSRNDETDLVLAGFVSFTDPV